jgi:serine/threonine protein kinase
VAASFEEVLLAIGVKNRFFSHDDAVSALSEFRDRATNEDVGIYDILIARRLLTQAQAETLAAAAKKVLASQAPEPATASDPSEPVPGYRIVGKLGAGGTSAVFLAESRKVGRRVALKIARSRDPKALAAFVREAELLVSFDHPNLVKGLDQGRCGPLTYVAMEHLDGESVQDILEREKSIPEARALEILLEAAKAVDYMQSRGLVHRDIKPGNIMVLKDGRVVVCDLGFAIPIGSADAPASSTTSGTAQYMSPEQARGQADIDIRADIYSLGATLYHMVMGELPFHGGDSLEVMAKHVMEALNSTEIKNRRISRHMHYFIERMMSKEKDLRYATPRELIDDINEQIEGFRSLEYKPPPQTETPRPRFNGGISRPPTSKHRVPPRRPRP